MSVRITSIAIAVLLFLIVPTAAHGVVLFEDHFDGGMASSEWVTIKPEQYVEDGWYHSQDPTPCCTTRDSSAVVHDGDLSWTDYSLQLQVDPIPTTGAWPDELERCSIWVRTRDAQSVPIGFGLQGYRIRFFGPSDFDFFGLGALQLLRVDDVSTELLDDVVGIASGGPMDVEVQVHGPQIQVWVDEQPVFDVTDPDPLLFGGIGFGAVWETHCRIDDAVVAELVGPVPATSTGAFVAMALLSMLVSALLIWRRHGVSARA